MLNVMLIICFTFSWYEDGPSFWKCASEWELSNVWKIKHQSQLETPENSGNCVFKLNYLILFFKTYLKHPLQI